MPHDTNYPSVLILPTAQQFLVRLLDNKQQETLRRTCDIYLSSNAPTCTEKLTKLISCGEKQALIIRIKV